MMKALVHHEAGDTGTTILVLGLLLFGLSSPFLFFLVVLFLVLLDTQMDLVESQLRCHGCRWTG